MIYFTGDIHGDVRQARYIIDRNNMKKNDVLVLLGDVGLNYYGNNHGDKRLKRYLNDSGTQIFCIHGNHEERPFNIDTYNIYMWHGGQVYVEDAYPNIMFAKDGELYDLDGHTAIVLGGAYSVDKHYRLMRGLKWFKDEQPSSEIKQYVESQLNKNGWDVDLVLSHTCPLKYMPVEAFMPGLDQSTVDHSTEEWLDDIEDNIDYKFWLCGHWHINKHIDKIHFLMHDVESMDMLFGRLTGE